MAAAAALLLVAPSALARDCPPAVKAPGDRARGLHRRGGERAADERRPVGSAVKLMTALLTLERADLSDRFRATDYRPSMAESKIGLVPGERMSVRDLLRGLLAESGNDAAMALAVGVAGSERAFVRQMNRRARGLGLKNTRYRNPIGLDEPGAYSSARDLVTLATLLRTKPFFRRTVNKESVRLTTGDHPRTFDNRNDLVRTAKWINGVKTGHTASAGYVLVGSGRRNGIQVVSGELGTPSERARDADSLALLTFGRRAFQRITAAPEGRSVGVSVPIRFRRGAELGLVIGPNGQRTVVPDGQRDRVVVKPTELADRGRGPDRRRHPARRGRRALRRPQDRDRPPGGGLGRREGALARNAPSPGSRARSRSCSPSPSWAVRCCWHGGGGDPADRAPGGLARRPGPHDHPGHPQHGHRQDASVPNFRLGRRHRTVEQTTMPGGKGVNVARVLKTLGAPVIATGFTGGADRHPYRRPAHQPSVLSDFVRIREESRTNTAVIDPTTGEQTEINERGPKVSEQETELFVDKLLYLAKGASMCVFAGSLPREVDIDIYARLIRELRRLGVTTLVDTDGDPLRRAVRAEPDLVSPNVLQAEAVATSSTTTRTGSSPCARWSASARARRS